MNPSIIPPALEERLPKCSCYGGFDCEVCNPEKYDEQHQQMTTDTPRTNKEAFAHFEGFCVSIAFARRLEIELTHSLQNQVKTQAEVERLKTVKDYWANLWADLSHAAISDNVRLEKRAEKAEAEVEEWKQNFIAFGIVHVSRYGEEHFGKGALHPIHYDLLERAGCRMDSYKKATLNPTTEDSSAHQL